MSSPADAFRRGPTAGSKIVPKDSMDDYEDADDNAEVDDLGAQPTPVRSSIVKKSGKQVPLNASISNNNNVNIHEALPLEYKYNPTTTAPILYYLPRLMQAIQPETKKGGTPSPPVSVSVHQWLRAAGGDVRLHRARVQAGIHNNLKLIRTYQLDSDPDHVARIKALEERSSAKEELLHQADTIIQELTDSLTMKGLTAYEKQQLQLARWQRALELYVYETHSKPMSSAASTSAGPSSAAATLDWQSLFEKLLSGISEDQDISQVLQQASQMCQVVVSQAQKTLQDAAAMVTAEESAYVIRLQAHGMFSQSSLRQVHGIEEQFVSAGKAALQIGHQLEHAEMKRSQCEAASVLLRRWWILESLAEQEQNSGALIPVEEEIEGLIPPNSARLDHLFTKPENSLEAAKALKQLRAVARARGNNSGTGGMPAGADASGTSAAPASSQAIFKDEASQRRFAVTAALIARVSDALESRLLQQFTKIYSSGGTYDFSHKPRPGAIDWRELRSIASSLLLFDSGRNLHKRYVDMVVATRFPELFMRDSTLKDENDADVADNVMADDELDTFEKKREFNVDATRTKLSALFHKVSDVCTAEFELIAHVFGSEGSRTDLLDGSEEMPLVVARSLLQRVVSDPRHGLQSRINELLTSIDRLGDFDAGAKKLDTFVVIHEKAAGLFRLLRDAADRMAPDESMKDILSISNYTAAVNAVESLKGFLTSQELALSNTHRQSYINLELRLLHHDCCSSLDQAGCTLVKSPSPRPDKSLAEKGILEEYRAPILPLHMESLQTSGLTGILAGPLKQSVLRQPLIYATDSLSRARLMFGTNKRGGETTSRVILSVYNQMCSFFGEGFLYPIVETLREMLPTNPPSQPPVLPFDEEQDAPDLGVPAAFWVALERVHSAAKSFDRELWAEGRAGSERVWETLEECGDPGSVSFARGERVHFYAELERRGEAAILRALDSLSAHVQWILVTGGESMLATGGKRITMAGLGGGSSGGPYAIPAGSSLDTPNSPAVKALAYCLRVQFVHVQAALTPQSLASFWTALSMRMYDILVARLLQHYLISTVGAVILSRDVEALRSVAMLAGSDHSHWDSLRELLTLYMTPPDAIKSLLTGPEGEPSRGLFSRAGRDRALMFLSRRNDYRYKSATGMKKSVWVAEMLEELNVTDPTDGPVNIGLFAAGRKV
jgi:Exocyst complex component Sec10